ncbi:hypothetical protein [Enterobacter chengduensis]|uniref:hypothetical protein n=1 Tax=Enterobacter chengduensis TaxID=2494701 RepID=UPI002006C716|nr:hypothetical protein [Enterobacter chengduensis]MCK7450367.1 hypothetical protein [Enterobacter chengduensis]
MEEGFYWIQHNGRIQVAYFSNGVTEDLESGLTCNGIWHLTQGDDICDNGEAEVLLGPLSQPVIK